MPSHSGLNSKVQIQCPKTKVSRWVFQKGWKSWKSFLKMLLILVKWRSLSKQYITKPRKLSLSKMMKNKRNVQIVWNTTVILWNQRMHLKIHTCLLFKFFTSMILFVSGMVLWFCVEGCLTMSWYKKDVYDCSVQVYGQLAESLRDSTCDLRLTRLAVAFISLSQFQNWLVLLFLNKNSCRIESGPFFRVLQVLKSWVPIWFSRVSGR